MGPMRIGVLGGIGPEATGIFYLKLIKKLQESGLITRNEDFPQIIINSIPAPELISDQIKDSELEVYRQGLKELDSMNLDFIVMVCNTIHLFHQQLQAEINTPLLNLKNEVCAKIKELNLRCISVLGTAETVFSGLYQLDDISYLNPNLEEVNELSRAIFNFNKGYCKENQVVVVAKIAEKYLSKGSQLILLGCTELGVMLEDMPLSKLNTIDILADSVVRQFKNLTFNDNFNFNYG